MPTLMNHSARVRTQFYDKGLPKRKLRVAKKLKSEKLRAGKKAKKQQGSKEAEESQESESETVLSSIAYISDLGLYKNLVCETAIRSKSTCIFH